MEEVEEVVDLAVVDLTVKVAALVVPVVLVVLLVDPVVLVAVNAVVAED